MSLLSAIVLPKTRTGNLLLGMATAVIGPVIVRPILVGVVRAGYEVKEFASSTWQTAKAEALSIRSEAAQQQAANLEAEVSQLRSELASLRTSTRKTATA